MLFKHRFTWVALFIGLMVLLFPAYFLTTRAEGDIDSNRFLLGINYPWIHYGIDFGTTAWGHDGVSAALAGWWRHQTYDYNQGITKVVRSSDQRYTGKNSLKLIAKLVGDDPDISKGEAFRDLRLHGLPGLQAPVDLEDITLRCWVYAPMESHGDPDHPNGLQVFAKDAEWRGEYGTWINIREGQWNEIALTPSREAPYRGWMDPGFDPTRIVMVGVKAAIGKKSSAEFEGAFYMDSFRCGDDMWFDFENPSDAELDFEEMSGCGIREVRWFIFADGRASPEFDVDGMVTGYDPYFYDDMDAALEAAQNHGIHLIPVLFDYFLCNSAKIDNGVQLGGRADLITDPVKQQSFIDNALNPMLERYGSHPNILLWDIINEPEWAMLIEGGGSADEPVTKEAMQEFVSAVSQCIRENTSQQLVTVGAASRKWLYLWADVGLDLYQYHYYDWMEMETPFDIPYYQLGLDKPCFLGEFPTGNSNISVDTYLERIWSNGFAGALGWSFRAGDESSEFSCVPFTKWLQLERMELDLYPGWNFVSTYFNIGDNRLLSVLAPIQEFCRAAWTYDANPGWKYYIYGGPHSAEDLDIIEPGKGYMIHMNSAATLRIMGTRVTDTDIPLNRGWNLVGYLSATPQSPEDAFSSLSDGTCIYIYDIGRGTWLRYVVGGFDPFNNLTQPEPGKAYWIRVEQDCVWTIPP